VRKNNYRICLFSYAFPHKKTNDFIKILQKEKLLKVVIGAPKIKLKIKSNWKPKSKIRTKGKLYLTKYMCKKNNINYLYSKHDNYSEIRKLIKKYKINLGIISGSRILKPNIIKLFEYGIINFHPGKIPETSGLDSLYWTIKKKISPFVTIHFIDKYVDKGRIISEKKVKLIKKDTITSLSDRIYQNQLYLLRNILSIIKKNKKIKSRLIKNYSKNEQLSTEEKKEIFNSFEYWKKNKIK
tara:strand:- start:816 stop:1535 length:720 start_codon:yes stop_codon:yes gene_type:complete